MAYVLLFLPVDNVDILSTNVDATPTIFGGGVSLNFRCAAPTVARNDLDCSHLMMGNALLEAITFLHNLCRVLEDPSRQKPTDKNGLTFR